MIIEYINRTVQTSSEDNINAKRINYEISQEDMELLASCKIPEYDKLILILNKDNMYNFLIDDITRGKTIDSYEDDSGRKFLSQLIVYDNIGKTFTLSTHDLN